MILAPSGRFRGAEVIDASREHLEPEELPRLFAQLDAEGLFWKAYFRLQFYLGCRVSEPAIVFREDVSIATSQILLRRLKKPQFGTKAVVDESGKKRRARDEENKVSDGFSEHVYTLPPALCLLLDEHMKATKGPNPWLFPSPRKPRKITGKGERMSLIRRANGYAAISRWSADNVFEQAARKAGLPEHLRHSHVLRHTRATLLYADGATENDVQDLLGHSSVKTTRRYIGAARAMRLRLQTTARLGLGLGEGW